MLGGIDGLAVEFDGSGGAATSGALHVDFTERVSGNRSSIDSPLMDAIEEWVAAHDSGAKTVPTVMPGFTDSHRFRAAFPECVAYGFFPQRHQSLLETQALMHAAATSASTYLRSGDVPFFFFFFFSANVDSGVVAFYFTGARLRIDFTERITGNRSPIASPLMDALDEWISAHDPGAKTVPTILPGFTDSRHFRAAFPECVAYGFFPQRHQSLLETQALIHAPDERIDVRDLEWATEFYRDLALGLLG